MVVKPIFFNLCGKVAWPQEEASIYRRNSENINDDFFTLDNSILTSPLPPEPSPLHKEFYFCSFHCLMVKTQLKA